MDRHYIVQSGNALGLQPRRGIHSKYHQVKLLSSCPYPIKEDDTQSICCTATISTLDVYCEMYGNIGWAVHIGFWFF